MVDTKRFILVGRLGRSRGVKGEIYVTPLTDFPQRFLDLDNIYVDLRGSWQLMTIERARMISERPVLKLVGVNTPEEAGKLTNLNLAVTDEHLVKLPEGSHWVFDLIGSEVFDADTEERIGKVIDVFDYPANDVYLIRGNDGQSLMLPAISNFVTGIDSKARKITVRSAGLVEQGSSNKKKS